jgi:type 2 lantibiotic biosynthesis protein LanM
MNFSRQDLIPIVERASTMGDRLGSNFIIDESRTNEALVKNRLEKWCQVVARGNEQKFEKRLAWDNLDIDTIRPALGSVRLVEGTPLPNWTETLWESMQFAASLDTPETINSEQYRYLNAKEPLPFEEILVPFVEVARKQLMERIGDRDCQLSQTAWEQLERSLLQQLAGLFSFPLELEFSIFRSFNESSLTRLLGQLQGSSSRQKYLEFVKNLLSNGFLSFFQEYSVLARLSAIAVDFWVDSMEEFLVRLAEDRKEIQEMFQVEGELGRVVATETGLSDPHNCGRSVIIITFDSGLKLVYKPKDLGLERAYFEFLGWLNEQKVALPFQLLKVLNRSTHGWMEFARSSPCNDREAVGRFYQRAGMVLAIVYALRGTDCHSENLIACGEQPILVDLETLLHHRTWASKEDADAQTLASERLQDSVAGTALLPGWQLVPYGQGEEMKIDLSGLGGYGEQEIPLRALKWQQINTDSMTIAPDEVKMRPKQNRPFCEGVSVSLNEFEEEIVDGFRQMYRFLAQRQKALLAEDGLLAAFARQKVRLVFRNTSVYFSILKKSLHPKSLRDGVDRAIEFDLLGRAFLNSEEKHPFWSLLSAEQQALEQLDIPFFTAYSNSDALNLSENRSVEKFLDRPSYQDTLARIQQLNEIDLAEQIKIIRGSLYASVEGDRDRVLPLADTDLDLNTIRPLEKGTLVKEAIAIGQDIQHQAIRALDGSVTWIGMGYLPKARRFQIEPLNYSFDNGCCGISLFLAALSNIAQRSDFGDLALSALQSFRKDIQAPDSDSQRRIVEKMGIGGSTGLGAAVYAFVRIARLLDRWDLIEDARRLAGWMVLDKTATVQEPGLMTGIAGAILGLLTLYEETGDSEVLAQATIWAKKLLSDRAIDNAGYLTWMARDGKSLTGFYNGAAGIAYALLRLYAVTQDVLFLSAAEEAVASERIVLALTDRSHATSLSHGISGVALARLGGLAILDTTEIRHEIEDALQITQQLGLEEIDNLYCGNFGRIDLFLVAAQHLSQLPLLEIARKQAAWSVNRASQSGGFKLLANLPSEVYHPGFFWGTAGIGYELLRLVKPDSLPSVLLWQ